MRVSLKNFIIHRAACISLIVVGSVPNIAVADQRSSASRNSGAGAGERHEPPAVYNSVVAQLEEILSSARLIDGSSEERIGLYAYLGEVSRRLTTPVLALPDWRGSFFNPAYSKENDLLTWNSGVYLLTSRDLPLRASVVQDISCSLIRVDFDLYTESVGQNACIQGQTMKHDETPNKSVVLEAPSRVCIYSKVDPRVDAAIKGVDRLGLATMSGRDLASQVGVQVQSSLQKSGIGLYGKGGSPIVSSFSNIQDALAACKGEHNAVLATVGVSVTADGKPYELTAQITQAGRSISSTFDRDALAILTPYYRSIGPLPWSDKPPALRTGPNLSIDTDIAHLFQALLDNVVWRNS